MRCFGSANADLRGAEGRIFVRGRREGECGECGKDASDSSSFLFFFSVLTSSSRNTVPVCPICLGRHPLSCGRMRGFRCAVCVCVRVMWGRLELIELD